MFLPIKKLSSNPPKKLKEIFLAKISLYKPSVSVVLTNSYPTFLEEHSPQEDFLTP
jgi:hypothetical protein